MPEPLGEFARIRALVAGLPGGDGVIVGPGDDAAVLRARDGVDLVVTTDTFVEGRHFRRELLSPTEAGARFAAANLSDLAAMAARPRWAVLALVLPDAWSPAAVQAFEQSCAQALAADGATIVGGNLASGPVFAATLTLIGEVTRGAAWLRAGARADDLVVVTGVPGSAGAFTALAMWASPPSRESVPTPLVERFVSPASRVAFATALAPLGAVHAAIDLSDGLTADLAHVLEASGVGAVLEAARWPADEALWAASRRLSAWAGQERGPLPAPERGVLDHWVTGPSDDYELLLAVDPAQLERAQALASEHRVPFTVIGRFTADVGLRLESGGATAPFVPRGWDHFAAPE